MNTQYYKDEYGSFYKTNSRRRTYDFYGANDERLTHRWFNRCYSKSPFHQHTIRKLTEISLEDYMLEMI